MSKELTKGLRVHIHPRGWASVRPVLHIFDGVRPVLTAYVSTDGHLHGWTTSWGLYGPELSREEFSRDMLCGLMGWRVPA